jgi:hypothetical protein
VAMVPGVWQGEFGTKVEMLVKYLMHLSAKRSQFPPIPAPMPAPPSLPLYPCRPCGPLCSVFMRRLLSANNPLASALYHMAYACSSDRPKALVFSQFSR